MKATFSLCAASLLILASTGCAETPAEADEMAIYKTLFTGKDMVVLAKPDPQAKPPDLSPPDAKRDSEYTAWLKKKLPGVQFATISDYRRCQLASPLLTPGSDLGVKLVFVEQKVLDDIFRDTKHPDDGWARFRERFHAHSLTHISRVSFNTHRTQALVFLFEAWASVGAEGWTILLEKTYDGKWIVKGQVMEVAS
jgi:hypothetical protein